MTRSNIVIKKKHNTRSKILEMKKNSKLILKFTIKPKVTIDSSFIDDSIDKPVESTILEEPRIVTTPTNIDSPSPKITSTSPKLSYIPAPTQDFSPKGIIQIYYPSMIKY